MRIKIVEKEIGMPIAEIFEKTRLASLRRQSLAQLQLEATA